MSDEGSIKQFVNKLLDSNPQNPKSINLEIESENTQAGFECLVEIFVTIMKHLYGDGMGKVDLSKLMEKEIDLVTNYFKSFGYKLYVQVSECDKKIYSNYIDPPLAALALGAVIENDLLASYNVDIDSKGKIYKIFFEHF